MNNCQNVIDFQMDFIVSVRVLQLLPRVISVNILKNK